MASHRRRYDVVLTSYACWVSRLPSRLTILKQRQCDVIYDLVLTSRACWIYRLPTRERTTIVVTGRKKGASNYARAPTINTIADNVECGVIIR